MPRLLALTVVLLIVADFLLTGRPPGASAAVPINVSASPGTSENPSIAAALGRLLVVWEEGDALSYALREDGTWLPAAPVPGALGSSPRVAGAPDGAFDLVWSSYDELEENFDILYSRHQGGTWSLPVSIAETSGDSISPDIDVALDGSRLVVWIEVAEGVRSLYAGSPDTAGDWSYGPLDDVPVNALDLAWGRGVWQLVWEEDFDGDGSGDALFRSSDADGWAVPDVVFMGGASVTEPSLSVDSEGRPMTTWRSGDHTVRHTRRVGDLWSDPAAVDGGMGASGRAVVALDAGGAVVAWSRGTDVLVAREVEGQWAPPTTAMSFGGRARGVAVAATGGGPVLVAEGRDAEGNGDIYFARLGDQPPATGTGPPPTASATNPAPTATGGATPSATDVPSAPSRVLLPLAQRGGG